MNETLVHRGPDSSGAFVEGNVGLAARRLSIIDLAGGDQPIGNEDGRIQVVQNGEIYNHAELRARLERAGHRFATRSDTEVLVHLYEEHGPAFVEQLRGMFAIALWDRLERRLVLARDRFGIKPLYYRVAGGELSFASELKALLRHARLLARGRPRRAGGVPGLQLDPGAADDLRRGAQAAAGAHAAVASGASRPCAATHGRAPRRPAASGPRTNASWPRSCASGCATRCARTSCRTCRWACCSRAGSTPRRWRRWRRARAPTG